MNNVLMVHQGAELYGSDKTLLMLVEGLLRQGSWWPIVIVPFEGPLIAALRALGAEVHVADVLKVSRATLSGRGLARMLVGASRCLRRIDVIVARRPIAVVYSNTVAVLGGAVWARRRRLPHVWHVHEIVLSPGSARRGFPFLVAALAHRVIANSRATRDWLCSAQPRLGRVCAVVFNGVPTPVPPPAARVAAMRRRLGAGESDVLISLVGRLNHWKGHEVLLDALGRLEASGRAGRLRVAIVGSAFAGQEHHAEAFRAQSLRLGLGSLVTFVPFVDDVWPVWFATDIAAVPSTEPEPFGLVAIEAMAAGVPVVAARHGGLEDIVVDGLTGALVTPRDATALAAALDSLGTDGALRRSLGEAGRARQRETFSVEAYVGAVQAVLADVARR